MDNYFFITSLDDISRQIISTLVNSHDSIACDTFFTKNIFANLDYSNQSIDEFVDSDKKNNKFCGSIGRYFCFELQQKTILEKTNTLHRKANILVSPQLRIKLLLKSWQDSIHAVNLDEIREQLRTFTHHPLHIYNFFSFYDQIVIIAKKEHLIDVNNPDHQMFLMALANVIAFDSADLPVPGKSFCLEKLLTQDENCLELLNYITAEQLDINDAIRQKISAKRLIATDLIHSIDSLHFDSWQESLINYFLNIRLRTLYYPHIDQPLTASYKSAGLPLESNQSDSYTKLISIQLNSNRPAQLNAYFNNIEETADNPQDIEILVNIDTGHQAMKTMLEKQIATRKFTLKYIETTRPQSFCDLWKPINKLLEITDPGSYFLLNISDEMLFMNSGWDTLLKKYVGFYPDHLFRLRASRNRYRNYFDRWECSFAQDAIPITTKKWIDIGGNWNPCFGPDSFQQLISFYLAKEGKFSNEHCLRDVPIFDIRFSGDVPALGIAPEKAWKHISDHIYAMQICQSYPMQLEAKRRAMMIKAHMIAHKHQLTDFNVIDHKNKRQIHVINKINSVKVAIISYKVSRIWIFSINQWRKLAFFTYFGDGRLNRPPVVKSFLQYLNMKHYYIRKLYLLIVKFNHSYHPLKQMKFLVKKILKRLFPKIYYKLKQQKVPDS